MMPFNLLRGLSFQNKPLSFVLLVGLLCQELKPDESHVQRGQDMSLPECVAQGEVGWERQTFLFFTPARPSPQLPGIIHCPAFCQVRLFHCCQPTGCSRASRILSQWCIVWRFAHSLALCALSGALRIVWRFVYCIVERSLEPLLVHCGGPGRSIVKELCVISPFKLPEALFLCFLEKAQISTIVFVGLLVLCNHIPYV